MSEYGEGIINRLHPKSPLRNPNNPMHTLIHNTVGAWLDNYSIEKLYENSFLDTATGAWLDLFGNEYGVTRHLEESDTDYRKRIIYEAIGNLSVKYLVDIYDLTLYTYLPDFSIEDNSLTSDNPYMVLSFDMDNLKFMSVASDEIKAILDKKFLIDGGIEWLTL